MNTNERIKQDKPLEIWRCERSDWTWKVYRFYKAPGKTLNEQRVATKLDQYGRVFCGVQSPFTDGSYELGDVYYAEIRQHAVCTFREDEGVVDND
ncbi:MAG: hypothetical protein ACXABY_13120 [Candidatus Thorarchaeota archaeon]|jgi:hypothetical protein